MENIIIDNISLMLLLPFWIFLIIMCGRFFSVYVNDKIVYALTLLSSLFGIFVCSASLMHLGSSVEWIYPFIKIGSFAINCGLQVDKLSLILSLMLFVVSFAVQIYSIKYMKDEKKKYRFFAFLNLFNFSMGTLLFSPNLFQMYVFWEIAGVVSYMLIGFDYANPIKSEASRRVFIINRIGDCALLGGIILITYFMYSYSQNAMLSSLSFEDMNVISTLTLAYASPEIFFIICTLFIVAAMVKSAQFPFYTWLQDAMEARIPVSALLHSATLVVLGVYLLIRLMPFFTLSHIYTNIILLVGVLTAVICSILASIEINPKKILAYSTSANLGLMFAALGIVNIKLALIILGVHAFAKSMLFLLIPENKKVSYYSVALLIMGALIIAGLLLSGVGVKELLFANISQHKILPYILLFIAFVSAYYISRFVFISLKECEYSGKIGIVELSSIILLAGNIGIYLFLRGTYNLSEPVAAAIGGLCLAILLFKNKKLETISNTPKLMEKFNNQLMPYLYDKISCLSLWFEKNICENYRGIIYLSKSGVRTAEWIENNVMNASVSAVSKSSRYISLKDKKMQSGNVQNYNAYGFIILTIIIVLVIMSYIIIMGQLE